MSLVARGARAVRIARWVTAARFVAALLGWVLSARAQPGQVALPGHPARATRPAGESPDPVVSLQDHLALALGERLLASDSSDDRVRGVERLASSGQREAIDRLVRALESSSPVSRDPRARLSAIRALAPFVSRDAVRQVLAKALSSEPGRSPLALLAQQTAAMTLAASDDPRAVEVLVAAFRQGGSAEEASERALLAYPPKSLAAFGSAREGLAPPIARLLGRLGDVRAIGLLRATLARGFAVRGATDEAESGDFSPEERNKRARIAAAQALARLGDEEQLPVARSWILSDDLELKLAGAQVLLESGAQEADSAIAASMQVPALRAAGIRLATRLPRPALVLPLIAAAGGTDYPAKIALAALAQVSTGDAVQTLAGWLRNPEHAEDAAFALARAPGAGPRRALEALMSDPLPLRRRLAARAGIVREMMTGDGPGGLVDALESLLRSADAADRAAGAYGLVALRKVEAAALIRSNDRAVVRAAARASLVAGDEAGRACMERLARETDPLTRVALAMALAVAPAASELMSTEQLSVWSDSGEALSPLAAFALGEREQAAADSPVRRLLTSPDPVLRAHAALGLARSPVGDAAGRLADALRFEPDPAVRRSMIAALAQRREPQRLAALELAMRLDPDARARELARLALAGQLPWPILRGGSACRGAGPSACHVAWIALLPSSASSLDLVRDRPGLFLDFSGISLPVVSDPDGSLLLAGVSGGPASFRLASSPLWYDARAHDVVEAESGR